MKTKALYAVLSRKHKDGEILFIDSIAISKPSTKTAKGVVSALSSIKGFESFTSRKRNLAYIALPKQEDAVERSFRNFGNLNIEPVSQLNIVDVLNNKYLVVVGPDVF